MLALSLSAKACLFLFRFSDRLRRLFLLMELPMSLFQRFAAACSRTFKLSKTNDPELDFYKNLSHADRGLSGEAGELTDAVKRHLDYGLPLDIDNIEEEVGDALFYLQTICTLTGLRLDAAMEANIAKLQKRFPEGFTQQAAVDRADKAN